jgi:uncharacterized protein YcbX
MRGEELARAYVAFSGIAGDRVHAFVDPALVATKPNFPWVSARQVPEMLLFQPRFVSPPEENQQFPSSERFRVEVTTPEGAVRALEDPAFLAELEARWKRPLILRFSEKGMQDSRPISIFGAATLEQLSGETSLELDPRRFRANFLIEWADPAPKHEEALIGKPLQIGEKLQLTITKRDPRCVIINLDPETSQSSPEVLMTVGKAHGGRIGVYAAVLQDGVVAQGDGVFAL